MALPSGFDLQINGFRVLYAPDGNVSSVGIDYALCGPGGTTLPQTYTIPSNPGTAVDPFTGDGETTAFSTTAAPYDGEQPSVSVAQVEIATGFKAAANTDGTWTFTFATAPAKGALVQLRYPNGPALSNSAGDLLTTLGLSSEAGTVFSGNGKASAHQHIADVAGLQHDWAVARVLKDRFGG